MSQLVTVTVNGRAVEVPAGTLVTDAARAAEVHVPIFCSHDKLPPLGACRICVVEVGTPRLGADKKPVLGPDGQPEIAWMPKVQTGCTTFVSDGMHVRTESPVAVKARKGVMEFLLVNHRSIARCATRVGSASFKIWPSPSARTSRGWTRPSAPSNPRTSAWW
jgi:NADH-quinone oxidoreductase subunit G